ncbi:sigma E regulatory protein, MucB/RseB [Dickeya chrysanthemi Ech1591]|uniref:Sigma E regulatory protein, MucB/RseB n=1 Tax=Dickeya chrysanthemi (strain Ech1591) TaxID=561229 RepID=C6CNL6_DICC1|nr:MULTISPECIES: sigma-E factor regulatory protein RseB [Dickeya]ACT05936.1 sigma E regulatory protein, MucB/RseB [Dickeya chrysanthemi Ech1591]TYL43318.1 sigma-E factor regulatory protein RseB [Dickeya sp. ws52]
MKRSWFAACVLLGSLSYSSLAPASDSGALLQQMSSASRSLNYEIYYISVSRQGIESLRYRHTVQNGETRAELIHLDGPKREVIQRGGDISYFEADAEPFTLSGDHIVDSLPALIFANIERLSSYYDFIPTGRIRLADRQGDVVRIVSRDGTRFSYIICLDAESRLPLRVDLLDQNGELLEQFRAISVTVDKNVQLDMKPLDKGSQPPSLSIPSTSHADFNWMPEWLPVGVQEVSRSQRQLPGVTGLAESRLYSDGLFSFSVNISPVGENHPDQNASLGRRTIHTEVRDNREITVIGELPLATAKRIADNVLFKAQP